MEIKDYVVGYEREVRKTRITDGNREYEIHTDILGGMGSSLDIMLQGFDTTGLVETLVKQVKPKIKWLENTKFQTETAEKCKEFHQMLIEYYKKYGKFDKDFRNVTIRKDSFAGLLSESGFWKETVEENIKEESEKD